MKITGTMINYYFHCKRQCYLFSKNINLEDNSEDVRIGRVLHEIKNIDKNTNEIKLENIALDKINSKYVTEFKKSDSDPIATKMQLLFYLKKLNDKGIIRKGKIKYYKKNNKDDFIENEIVLNLENKKIIEDAEKEIQNLLNSEKVPEVKKIKGCKKCAYYDYCYI